jgi:hypothetical protein
VRAEEAGAVRQSGESTASTTEQPPQAAEPPDTAPARRTYQILNWRALSERLDKLIEDVSAGTSDAPRQDLSVVETVVTRLRDQSTLRPAEFVVEARASWSGRFARA